MSWSLFDYLQRKKRLKGKIRALSFFAREIYNTSLLIMYNRDMYSCWKKSSISTFINWPSGNITRFVIMKDMGPLSIIMSLDTCQNMIINSNI